uniref:13.3 kDa salivary protein n=1 Tax=Anopheles atroparvus TaxID=41427 RepID=A0AAG5DAE5_ANOAO
MKFFVFSAVLCALVATGTAQTAKSPKILAMQNGLGSMLELVKDLTVATNDVISDINVQAAMKNANNIITAIKKLYPVYGTTNTSGVTTSQRNKLNTALNAFKNAITALEAGLSNFPISPANLSSQLKTLHNAFLGLGGSVVPL